MISRTRAEGLASSLEHDLQRRQMAPGDYIGTMEDLREQTGYGRATVSEAVRLLRDRGIVEIRPGRGGGLFAAAANPVVRLRHTLLTVREEPTTVADALIVREALESLVDSDAARYRSKADVAELRKLLNAMKRATDDTDRFMHANWALHERIGQITPNKLLKGIYLGTLQCVADLSARADSDEPDRRQVYLTERYQIHVELVQAIIAQDVERATAAADRHRG